MSTEINDSIIFLPKNKVDKGTYELTEQISKSPAFNHVRVMPDCHSSAYCCVGMTSQIEDKVIPQIVGGDIGCGISCINLDKVIKEKQYSKIDNMVKSIIPMGEKNHTVPITTDSMMDQIYYKCNIKLELLKARFTTYPFNDFKFNNNYYKQLISRAKSNFSSSNCLKPPLR